MAARLTSLQACEHDHRVPNAVLGEERDSLAFLEPVLLHQCCADVTGVFLYFSPIHTFVGHRIREASKLAILKSLQRRIVAVEEPIPHGELGGYCTES